MKLIIHRGTKEIGGSCVELATAKARILIDFGMPLVSAGHKPFDSKILAGKFPEELKRLGVLPDIKGLYKDEEKSIDAILISHSHMDHYGFLSYAHPDIPIYMSEGAKILMEISDIFTPLKIGNINAKVLNKRKALNIGDFVVTSYLVDHSAFDALAFMVEAEGKRLFYSGDFRGHGRKSALFKYMLSRPPKDIDCLLIEGSMIGRGNQIYKNERAVESKIEDILRSSTNISFLFASSQNIDRLVSAYKACLKTKRIFVIDIYAAYILDKLRKVSKNIPQFNWRNIRVKFIKNHADVLAKRVSNKLLYFYNTKKIDIFEINRKKSKILMLARDNSIFPLIVKGINDVQNARIIYSIWSGYLTNGFKQYCDKKGLVIEQVHTSGHATIGDLKSFSSALNPKMLIPIHTFYPEKYQELFKNVKVLKDKEVCCLN
ncbi:MAG: MBL fold metallo-hydrolase [Candidatus Omnitrophica bacterium]|nr:MBL fold metallo-hydrolase [Candidatus Omnitrophota bacterium]